jgi:molecular chaperone DnaK (HSP70)
MPAPLLSCPTCAERVSGFDQYCGVCGAVLARLRWSSPDDMAWHATDGHVAVRSGAKTLAVRFRNEGVVAAGLVLRAETVAELPDWVDREALSATVGDHVLVLPPAQAAGDFAEIEVPLVAGRLAPLFEEAEDGVALRKPVREAHLPFLTNLNEARNGRWTSRPFKLTLRAARRPWISPARSHYRFLPVELLTSGGLSHGIELHNEIEGLNLTGVRISDDPESPTPPGYERLQPEVILHRDRIDSRQHVEAGATWNDVLQVALATPRSAAQLGWFAALVEYLCEDAGGRQLDPICCRVQGRVGRGPTLRAESSSLLLPYDQLANEHAFALNNPGQLPVAVAALEILRPAEDGEVPAPERDWLTLVGLAAGDILEPGESRSLRLRIEPSMRPNTEFDAADSVRKIRLRHDGLPSTSPVLDLEVVATFGRAKEFVAGIDFGTTNSVVCIGVGDRFHALRLDRGSGSEERRMRSLMYFEGGRRGGDDGFLFGEAAFSSAAIRPENLVRSIKTVVARDPRLRYVFYRRIPGGTEQRVNKTPQALLNLFIAELRLRAEWGGRSLPKEAYASADLDVGTQIMLGRAVFSHPVETNQDARRALMEAAHHAGIDRAAGEVNAFFADCCIDEATAAVLAYVQGRVETPSFVDAAPCDERVVCFDMGGGTTDLAAVEVLGMAAFCNGTAPRVTVNLAAKTGAHFGGDDLDEMLAATILAEVRRQSERQKAPIALDDIERAIRSRSYAGFKTDYQSRQGTVRAAADQDPATAAARAEEAVLALYKLATDTLGKAEEAKRALSAADETQVDLPGTGWPREGDRRQAETENFVVRLDRAKFESQVRARIQEHLHLLDSVVNGAGWNWSEVTTLLFTGQGGRVPAIREEVARRVAERRGPTAPALLPAPDERAFDPKNCVAIGAAIWGASRMLNSWLQIRVDIAARLTFDVQVRVGPQYRAVSGLERGKTLPAKGKVQVARGVDFFTLHRDRNREPYVRFRFSPLKKDSQALVRVRGLSDYVLVVGGQEIKGEVMS